MEKVNTMTEAQIKKFAVGYPYPTDYVEILLRCNNFNIKIVHKILCASKEIVIAEVQKCKNEVMLKEKIVEEVLNIPLSQKQLDSIKVGWRAFYDNPERYRDSVVIDMVKLFLQNDAYVAKKEKDISEEMHAFQSKLQSEVIM